MGPRVFGRPLSTDIRDDINCSGYILGDMTYAIEDLVALLRTTRVTRGLTQRELGERIGSPQSYVARLEAGKIDPKLSSLVEVARALDLDLKLVPRSAVAVVDGAVRAHSLEQPPGNATSRAIVMIRGFAARLEGVPYVNFKARGELGAILADLERQRFEVCDRVALEQALRPLDRMIGQTGEDARAKPAWQRGIRKTRRRLAELLDRLMHARAKVPRPAFALDNEDA